MAPACSQLPGQNPKTIFDSSLPALSRKPTHEKIVNSTSVISLQSGPSSLLHCSCPSPGFSTSHMTCFQNFLNYILSVHLYFLIHFTHTANPLVKANIELLLFLGVLALAHCLKWITLKLLNLMLILKLSVTDKGKEVKALSHQICRRWNFIRYPWQSSSIALVNICKWIITNTHKIQTCKRERRESAERHRGVRKGCLHSDSALSMLTDLGQLNLPSLNPGVFQKRLKMIMPTSSNLLIKLHTHTHTSWTLNLKTIHCY